MGLNIKNTGNSGKNRVEQKNIEPGTYPARLVQIIDMGLQAQRPFQGKDKPPAQEIQLTYELVDEFMKDEDGKDIPDKPRWISETLPFFGLHADKAKSTQRYNAIDPNGDLNGDFAAAIGFPINVTIVNNAKGDKVYDNIATISAMRPKDAANCPPLVNEPKVFDLDNPDVNVFNKFPAWIQDDIKKNLNYEGSKLQTLLLDKSATSKTEVGTLRSEPKTVQSDEDKSDNPY